MGGTCLYVLDIALGVSKEEGFGDGVRKVRMNLNFGSATE